MASLNMNSWIKVKLTDFGKEIYKHCNDFIIEKYKNPNLKPMEREVDEDGYCSFQLWSFIEIFGKYIAIGAPIIIEANNIYFDEKDIGDLEVSRELVPISNNCNIDIVEKMAIIMDRLDRIENKIDNLKGSQPFQYPPLYAPPSWPYSPQEWEITCNSSKEKESNNV